MKGLKHITICAIFFVLGCEPEVVTIDLPDSQSRITVNSVIRPDSLIQIQLISTEPYIPNNDLTYISGATINLTSNSMDYDFDEISIGNQLIYQSRQRVTAEQKDFDLTIEKSGFESVHARTHFPTQVDIQELRMPDEAIFITPSFIENGGRPDENAVDEGHYYPTNVTLTDPADEKNFYQISLAYVDDLEITYYQEDTITIHQNEFLEITRRDQGQFDMETPFWSRDPAMDTEDAWAAYTHPTFNDSFFDGNEYSFELLINEKVIDFIRRGNGVYETAESKTTNKRSLLIALTSLNEELYNYMATSSFQYHHKDDPFGEPTVIFSNIVNGAGIFSCQTLSIDTLEIN